MGRRPAFDLTTCAEGVETAAQLAGLRALGCDLAQGFLMARPLPPEDFAALVQADRRW
jgi:EAL domain-containing protein (putative c-di-GMP-specific phosphodiesterase class I)